MTSGAAESVRAMSRAGLDKFLRIDIDRPLQALARWQIFRCFYQYRGSGVGSFPVWCR